MKKKFPTIPCPCPNNETERCLAETHNVNDDIRPLSQACGYDRFRVCKIRGDRKQCARMAQLGVFPGSEIELICPVQETNCMVKIKGSTVSLDKMSAENILVIPA